jgi:stage V sporulation protein S
MNRFFSKLDLRDIKIDPTGSRFPPDGEPVEVTDEPEEITSQAEAVTESPFANREAAVPEETFEPETPVYAEPEAPVYADANHHDSGAVGNGEAAEPLPAELSDVLKVSAKSRPSAVAGAIAGVVRELGRAEVQAIGAGATNQAVKAVAIARDYLRESGIEAVCLPSFIDVIIDNEDRTAILLVVEPRETVAD